MAPPMQRAPSGRLHGAASSAKAGLKRQASAGLSRAKSSARSLYSSSRKPTMERRPIKLLVLTWNVGNAAPDFAELAQWLPVLGGDFDLVAVGTQENDGYDKGPKKKSIFSHSLVRSWEQAIQQRLGADWAMAAHRTLWEMRLSVYARRATLSPLSKSPLRIAKVQTVASATGAAHLLGNKGGIVAKMTVGSTSLAFVSCHLAAHTEHLERRNSDCNEVLRETRRGIGHPKLDACCEHDHVIWLGDLNYRLDPSLDKDHAAYRLDGDHAEVLAKISSAVNASSSAAGAASGTDDSWAALHRIDQLKVAQSRGEAFSGFREGTLAHAPTFKVERKPGFQYKDQRVPSWCDRVLWKSMPPLADNIEQLSLEAFPGVSTSDHKPVAATFSIEPSPVVETCPPAHAVAVVVSGLSLDGIIAADLDGTSDPFCLFLSNPPAMLGSQTPSTTIKYDCATQRHADGAAMARSLSIAAVADVAAHGRRTSSTHVPPAWADSEVPVLRPLVRSVAELERITLLLAIFDHDAASSDDELGAVRVPLGFYAAAAAGLFTHRHGPDSYDIEVRAAPIVLGNAHAHTGTLTVTLHVSGGDALRPALAKAAHDGAGSRATTAEAVSWPYREKLKTALSFARGKKKSGPAAVGRQVDATLQSPRRRHTFNDKAPAPATAFPVTAAANAATARRKSKEAQEIAAHAAAAVAAVNGGAVGSNGGPSRGLATITMVRWRLPAAKVNAFSSMTDTVDVVLQHGSLSGHTRVLVDGRLVASGDGGGVYEFEAAGCSCAVGARTGELRVAGERVEGERVDPATL